jgi:hypothetical protein
MAKSTTPRSTARSTTPRKPSVAKSGSTPRLVPRSTPDTAAIAVRAYELFLESGAVHGYDREHWLQAEQELKARLLTSAA